ncbi:hypothetical protein ENBRE01_0769 [Enteropsectra breve]|nr:hypothetical protein ENBRE01_0769 [Enteropsectra breve]
MDFISFTGHKRTNKELLDKIKSISRGPAQLFENLNSLSIFNTIVPVKNKIALDEALNSIKMSINSSGNKTVNVSYPNIFGNGEFLKVAFKSLKDFKATVGAPCFIGNSLCKNKISIATSSKRYNDKSVEIKRAEISSGCRGFSAAIGIEKVGNLLVGYNRLATDLFGIGLQSKLGVTYKDKNKPFIKLIASKDFLAQYKNLFLESSLSVGQIFGQTNLTERFFLGSKIHGYKDMSIAPVSQNKKIGGTGFIEVRNKLGVTVKNIDLFLFGDLGVCTGNGVKESLNAIKNWDDNSYIGKSVGCGLALSNKKNISFIYSVPLTTSSETEKYRFGVDIEF